MRLTLRVLALFLVWWMALPVAMRIGSAWELQVHPLEGLTVTQPDGVVLHGAVSRRWGGEWLVIDSAGREIEFDMDSAVVAGRRIVEGATPSTGFPIRQFLPILLVTLLALGIALYQAFSVSVLCPPTSSTKGGTA